MRKRVAALLRLTVLAWTLSGLYVLYTSGNDPNVVLSEYTTLIKGNDASTTALEIYNALITMISLILAKLPSLKSARRPALPWTCRNTVLTDRDTTRLLTTAMTSFHLEVLFAKSSTRAQRTVARALSRLLNILKKASVTLNRSCTASNTFTAHSCGITSYVILRFGKLRVIYYVFART